jgi:hypothetical protein
MRIRKNNSNNNNSEFQNVSDNWCDELFADEVNFVNAAAKI